jgi:hypothetical protein
MPDLTLGSRSGQPRDQWRDIPQHLEYKALGCSQAPVVLKPRRRDHGPLQNTIKGNVYIYTPLLLLAYHILYSAR